MPTEESKRRSERRSARANEKKKRATESTSNLRLQRINDLGLKEAYHLYSSMACTIDFRRLDEGFGGKTYKRKRNPQTNEEDASVFGGAAMEVDETCPPPAKRSAVPSLDNPDKPSFGKPSYDGVIAGRVSGRKWKQPRKQRSSAVRVSHKGTTFEERAKEKGIKKAYKERMAELKDEIKRNKEEKRKLRVEREKKKQENILKSGTKLQVISNPKTIQKIAKTKDRKLLKPVPEHLISRNNKNRRKNNED